MKYISLLISISLLLTASLVASQSLGEIAYRIAEKDLIPEGIAYSSSRHSFFLSSLNKNKIIQINAKTGAHKDFIPSSLLGMKVLGLLADDAHNCLWACASGSTDDPTRATVAQFDLESGALLHSYERNDGVPFTVNDLAVDQSGMVYYTNRARNQVYFIDRTSHQVELVCEGLAIEHPNGISISPDNRYLYVASEKKGIVTVDIKTRTLLPSDSKVDSRGLDGLKFYQGSLIGVVNEVERIEDVRIVRFFLDSSLTRVVRQEIIDQGNPEFDIPTTCVVVGDELYLIANSQMGNLSKQGIRDPDRLQEVKILRYDLHP